MAYRYNGPCGKGFQRKRREQRQIEAEVRQEAVTHDNTKAHRLGKCEHGVQSLTLPKQRKRRRVERDVTVIRPKAAEEAAA